MTSDEELAGRIETALREAALTLAAQDTDLARQREAAVTTGLRALAVLRRRLRRR